jgi:adenosylcobinamide amidohydrolase
MTAADVRAYRTGADSGVEVVTTVGLTTPTLAAAPPDPRPLDLVGTINIVAVMPEPLTDAALVNAVATVTEAKSQALRDAGLDATGTPTDAVCVVCPDGGRAHSFGGPRSTWGAPLARAVHHAVLTGAG